MSRTHKDRKEQKARRLLLQQPEFKRSYRDFLENGSSEDVECGTCPECGAPVGGQNHEAVVGSHVRQTWKLRD